MVIIKIIEAQANLNLYKIEYSLHGRELSMMQPRIVLRDYMISERGMCLEEACIFMDSLFEDENGLNDFIREFLNWHHGEQEKEACLCCKKYVIVSELEENSTCYTYGNKRICDACAIEIDRNQY